MEKADFKIEKILISMDDVLRWLVYIPKLFFDE